MLLSVAVFGPVVFPDHLRGDRPQPLRERGTRVRRVPPPATRQAAP